MALEAEEVARTPEGLLVRCLRNIGPWENNVFLVSDTRSGEGYVVDAGYEPEAIAAAARGVRVRGILVTHGHRDHHEHAAELQDLLGAQTGIGEADRDRLSLPGPLAIRDGDVFPFGQHELRALHTPGHTPGSTCFLVDRHLFTGDTLFPGGPGNTDRDPVRFARIVESIRSRLFTLPDDTVVHPGHGRDTTIGAEKPQLDEWIARGW